jgi:uncharacterized membrane protein (UPF0127 family)
MKLRSIWDLDLESFELELEDKEFEIFIANTDQSRKDGLSVVEGIDPDEGMLFVFPSPGKHQMWMRDTDFPLDMIFLDEDFVVLGVESALPDNDDLIGSWDNVKYVVELPAGSADACDIQEGDELEDMEAELFECTEDPGDTPNMQVLDQDGNVQMEIVGGERIFSRISTKAMVEKAKSAETDAELIDLGRYVAKEIIKQNNRETETVPEGKGADSYDLTKIGTENE